MGAYIQRLWMGGIITYHVESSNFEDSFSFHIKPIHNHLLFKTQGDMRRLTMYALTC